MIDEKIHKLLAHAADSGVSADGVSVADQFRFAEPQIVHPRIVQHARARLLSAKRFVLDDAGAEALGTFVRECSDLVADHQEFAIPPYETMWVEWPLDPMIRAATGREPDAGGDTALGFLFDRGTVYCAVGKEGNLNGTLLLVAYDLHTPWPVNEQLAVANVMRVSRRELDSILWGEADAKLTKVRLRSLRNHHRIRLLRPREDVYPTNSDDWVATGTVDKLPPKLADHYHSLASIRVSGDLRNVAALLLLLNQPGALVKLRDEVGGRRFVGSKLRPFMSHTTVTLHLDKKRMSSTLRASRRAAEHNRRHDVRGHFCQDHRHTGCDHAWLRVDDRHWQCSACGAKRWWRREHARGSSLVGFNIKKYEVTA